MEEQIRIRWLEDLVFEAEDEASHTFRMDTSPEHGGGTAIRPVLLVMVGLAGCTGMDVVSILQKKRQKLTGFEVVVRGQRAADHPRKFERMDVEFTVRGQGIDADAVARAIELSETKYCSVHANLKPTVEITSSFRIIEEPAG